MGMKFSFVIPTYNCKALACSTIEAFRFLVIPDDVQFEVILVDDGSNDSTADYFQNIIYPFEFSYFYLERSPLSSRSSARNFGVYKSTGDYVVFIDADTVMPRDYLMELSRYVNADPSAVVIGQRLFLDHTLSLSKVSSDDFQSDYQISNCCSSYSEFRHILFNELSYNMSKLNYPFLLAQTCNIAYPRDVILAVDGFDEDMIAWGIEDIELAYRIFEKGLSFYVNPKMYVLHQFHGFQEEISVDDSKKAGIKENTEIFCRKHPKALPLNEDDAFLFFMSLATRLFDIEKPVSKSLPVVKITLTDSSDIDRIKSEIDKFSLQKDVNLIVFDKVENCNLDLWIQKLGKRPSTPSYFPLSLLEFYDRKSVEKTRSLSLKVKERLADTV